MTPPLSHDDGDVMRDNNEIERQVIEALRQGGALPLEGITYGYLPHLSKADVRLAVRRLRARGVIVPTAYRSGHYMLDETGMDPPRSDTSRPYDSGTAADG